MYLRLFPLQTVLFPGMRLPLHIFEDRYKIMIRECVELDAPFGVVLIRDGAETGGGAVPHNVGTTARIAQTEYLDDGRINLFCIGEQRFHVVNLITDREFLAAEAEVIEQKPAGSEAHDVLPRASRLFNEYLKTYLALGDQWTRGVSLPEDPAEAADYIAARIEAPPPRKQEWLEDLAPESRLASEMDVITQQLPDMRVRLSVRLRQKTSGFAVLN